MANATWTATEIYRATSSTGAYSLITTKALDPALPDTAYFDEEGGTTSYYKVRFYNASTGIYSGYADAITAQVVTLSYTTPSRVASLMQIRNSQQLVGFDGTTKPSIWEVVEFIQAAEDDIDFATQHSWREKKNYDANDANDYEIRNLQNEYKYMTGIPIHLDHRRIRQLDYTKGDSMQIFNGSEWEEWLSATTSYHEGRENDYWLDYRQGIVYLRTYIYRKRPMGFRIRYRYGEQTVPNDLAKAATFLVAADIMRLDDRTMNLVEGGEQMSKAQKAQMWEDAANGIIHRKKEFAMAIT